MRKRRSVFAMLLLVMSIISIGAAAALGFVQYQDFNQASSTYPAGTTIGGIPAGGLTRQQAEQRLAQAYSLPVELHYENSIIQVKPEDLGFTLDVQVMLDEADHQIIPVFSWSAFWNHLWNREIIRPAIVALQASSDPQQIRAYLTTVIAARYNHPAQNAIPLPQSMTFQAGIAGTSLEIDPAVPQIASALVSLSNRIVELHSTTVAPVPPSLHDLELMLRQTMDRSGFDGITEIYLQDGINQRELDLAYQNGRVIPPGIGFTAASTIKIPIMISIFRRVAEPTPADVLQNLQKMIEISENEPADWLMQHVIDPVTGPLDVSRDLQALGLKSTFLAGYFYQGAPLLQRFETPANQRKDFFTDPDPYNQTTPAEMGRLLGAIYQCSENGSGLFATVFPGQISQNECQQMITLLFGNHMPMLAAAGVPDGTRIAHKHGWVIEASDGLMHSICDAGIVYSPGSNFILTIYRWNKDQILFDPANQQMADLAEVVFRFFNPTPP